MSFTKTLISIAVVLASSPVLAQDKGNVPLLSPENAQAIKESGFSPRFVTIVGYTDTGVPITNRRAATADMGVKIAEIIEKEEAKLIAQGKMKPRKKPLTWEQRAALIAEHERLYGPSTTKTFIIPGTTPEESQRIHAQTSGTKISKVTGQAQYLSSDGEEILTDGGSCRIGKECSDAQSGFLPTRVETTVQKYEDPQSAKATSPTLYEDNKERSAEDIYREYFPDEFNSNQTTASPTDQVSWAESVLSFFVSNALAQIPSDSRPEISMEEFEAMKKMKEQSEAIEKKGTSYDEVLGFTREEQAKRTQKYMDLATSVSREVKDETRKEVAKIFPEVDQQKEILNKQEVDHTNKLVTYVFVSYSLRDDKILDILRRNAGRDDVVVVMRGIPDGQSLGQGIKHMQDLASKIDPIPNIIIDPTLFEEFKIKAVPTVARVKLESTQAGKDQSASRHLIAKVEGLHNDTWLNEKIEAGEKGNLGQQGDIFEIAERDMIEEMKSRAMAIDWESKKKEAVKRYWASRKYEYIPMAKEPARFEVDPTIIVTADLKDANGAIIHPAGTRINPLDLRPFDSMLVIFDPLNQGEIDLINEQRAQWEKQPYRKRIFIATRMDKEGGWDRYEALTEWLDAPLYVLTPEVKSRFHIKASPSLVTSDPQKRVFVIEELAKVASKLEEKKSK